MMRLLKAVAAVLVCACAVKLITRDLAAAPIITQIFPAGGAAGGPWVIAVLSDHYGGTLSDQTNFENDAKNLLVSGLLEDDNYKPVKSNFTIKTIHNPFPSTDPLHPKLSANSNYGFEAALSGNCEVSSLGATTAAEVFRIASVVSPRLIVVLG